MNAFAAGSSPRVKRAAEIALGARRLAERAVAYRKEVNEFRSRVGALRVLAMALIDRANLRIERTLGTLKHNHPEE